MKLDTMIQNVRLAQKKLLVAHIPWEEMQDKIAKYLDQNFDLLEQAYQMDTSRKLSKEKLFNQLTKEEEKPSESFRNAYGKVTHAMVPYGVIAFLSDSDIYGIFKMIVLAIQSKNGLVIHISQNVGTGFMLVEGIKGILERYGLEDLIELFHNHDEEIIEENELFDAFVYIGKKANAERFRMATIKPVIYSGCGNYELYVEDNIDEELVDQIAEIPNVKIFSMVPGMGQEVKSMEEAIARIEEVGSGYSVGIITRSRENAKAFVDKVKARNIFVNSSPTLVDSLDISINDLMYPKSVLVYE